MEVAKSEMLELVDEMPDRFEIEELQYRLYLRQKLEAAEDEIRAGHSSTHEEVVAETAKWFE